MSLYELTPALFSVAGVAATLLVAAYLHSVETWRARTNGLPLPPGPAPLPIVGNLLDMPSVRPWEGFRDLCAKHGVCLKYWHNDMYTHSFQEAFYGCACFVRIF